MIVSDPSKKLFNYFYSTFHPQSSDEKIIFSRFNAASLKYEQYKYCKKRIIELVKEFETDSGIQLDDEKVSKLSTYVDGFIITSRTVADLVISGLLMKRGVGPKIDSASDFLNKIGKDDKFKALETYDYWIELKNELFEDEFSWTRALFRRGSNRSLRDRTTHKQTIRVYPTLTTINQYEWYYEWCLETGEKIDTEDGFAVPIHQEFISYIEKIDIGMEKLIQKAKKEIYGIYGFE